MMCPIGVHSGSYKALTATPVSPGGPGSPGKPTGPCTHTDRVVASVTVLLAALQRSHGSPWQQGLPRNEASGCGVRGLTYRVTLGAVVTGGSATTGGPGGSGRSGFTFLARFSPGALGYKRSGRDALTPHHTVHRTDIKRCTKLRCQ